MDNEFENTTMGWKESDPLNPFEYDDFATFRKVLFFVQMYIVSTIKLILCVFIVANNTLLIFVICKFKRLQTKTNYILVNFAICTLFASIINAFLFALELFNFYRIISNSFIEVAAGTMIVLLETSVLLALLLSIDWFILANSRSILIQYEKFYKWVIVLIYLIPFLIGLLIYNLYNDMIIPIESFGFFIIYCICLLPTVIINIIKCRKTYTQESLTTSYSLYVSNIYFLAWAPVLLMLLLHTVIGELIPSYLLLQFLFLLALLFGLIAFSAPIIIVVMLVRYDKNFKMSFDSLFKRSVRGYLQDVENDNLHDDINI